MPQFPLKRTQAPAPFALLSLLALAFASTAVRPVLAADVLDVHQVGTPIFGAAGVTRTTGDIMLQQSMTAEETELPPTFMNEHELDRSHLRVNPESPRVASIPPMPPDQLVYHPKVAGMQALSPQTIGVNFLAAQLSGGSFPTGAFPPDNDGAVGPTQYVIAVNGRITSYSKATGAFDGVLNASTNTFFTSVRNGSGTSDPMCRFDRLTARWFITIINVSTPNRYLIAVSDAASNGIISGSTVWTYYFFIPATIAPPISNGSTCLSDYPSLGIDANALYMGVSEFCGSGQPFQQTDVFVIRKSSVLSGGPIVVTPFRALMSASGGYVGPFSARGVDNYDPSSNEGYFMGVDGASYGLLWLNRVANPGGTPTLSANIAVTVPITNQALTVPHQGNTGGANGNLDPLDDRLFAVHIRNQQLWTSQNIKVDNTGTVNATDAQNTRNGSRWYQFNVPVGSGTPTIVQSGIVFTQTANNLTTERHYWVPSVMVSGQGHAAMGFSTAGTNEFVNAGTVGRLANDPPGTMQTPVLLTTAANAYNPSGDSGAGRGARRWGDYTITSLDPLDDMSIWTVQQYTSATNVYGCRVARLLAPPPATPTALADVNAGQAVVNLTLTGSSVGGSGWFDPGADLASPARPFNHLSAAIVNGAATGTPPTVTSATYVNPTTVNLVLNASTATANIGAEKYTINVTNPDGQVLGAAVVHVIASSFTITASAGPNGSISPSGAVNVPAGGSQTFTISPNACYHINNVLVDGNSVGPVASFTFNSVNANHTISASFVIDLYTITASAGPGGTISPSGSVPVGCGTSQTFTIAPDGCHTIADVLVDGSSVGPVASYTFTNVMATHTIAASFTLNTYTIAASAGPGGSISPSGSVPLNCGDNQTFSIAPDPCFAITDVLVDGVSRGAVSSYTFSNVGANHTIAASFSLITYTIAASAGAGGSISPSGNVSVNCGDSQTFTIAADGCHTLADVLVDGSSVGPVTTYTFSNVQANHTIAASFDVITYMIVASAGGGGTISPSGAVFVACGTSQTFTITPSPCNSIVDVTVDGNSVGAVASYTFTSVTANHTITATFTSVSYTIAASAGSGGSISPSGSVTVNCGDSQTFTIAADPCNSISDVLVDGNSVGAVASYTFTNVTANHTIAASFAIGSFTITATAGTGGTIAPSGPVSVPCGGSQTFSIAANACYVIGDVVVDGNSVGATASYTFTNVTTNHTIAASFVPSGALPGPVTGLAAAQVKLGNDADGTTKITLTFTAPGGAASVEVWRKGYGDYPIYDNGTGAVPALPGAYPPAGWTLTGVTASGQTDEPATRDFWYYVAYAKDACGVPSVVSSMTSGTLDYHLGDVSNGITLGAGNNKVQTNDLSLLGAHYGVSGGALSGFQYLDVGPTTDHSTDARPTTDSRTDFEDLVMFAINFTPHVSVVAKGGASTQSGAGEIVSVAPVEAVRGGEQFDVPVRLTGSGGLQAISVALTWDARVVEPIGVTPGEYVTAQGGAVLSPGPGRADAALLGVGPGMVGEGALATIRFRALTSGEPAIGIGHVEGRDASNRSVSVMVHSAAAIGVQVGSTELFAAVPNPTRGSSAVAYSLSTRGPVDLSIYSVEGRRVKTLAHGVQDVGRYSMTWDGTDERGTVMRSGMFYVRLEAGGTAKSRVISVVR